MILLDFQILLVVLLCANTTNLEILDIHRRKTPARRFTLVGIKPVEAAALFDPRLYSLDVGFSNESDLANTIDVLCLYRVDVAASIQSPLSRCEVSAWEEVSDLFSSRNPWSACNHRYTVSSSGHGR